MRLFELTETQQPIVYVDMDGVLVDTYNTIGKNTGVGHYSELTPDQWEDYYSKLDAYTFFRDLPIFPTAKQLLSVITQLYGKFDILSSPLKYDVNGCIQGKKEWLAHRSIKANREVFDHDKARYAVSNNIPNILIDDSPGQLNAWKSAGGIAIPYQADKDSLDSVITELNNIKTQTN